MVRVRALVLSVAAVLPIALGCQPQFNTRSSEVRETRVLGIQSVPAEAPPNTLLDFSVLIVDPSGPVLDRAVDWAYCTDGKPTNETNDVSSACLAPSGSSLKPLGVGPTASGTIPINACRQFGPDVPQTDGGSFGRPADPDATGGFYQPVRLLVPDGSGSLVALGQVRVKCSLGSSGAAFTEFNVRYQRNENPRIDGLARADTGDPLPVMDATVERTRVPSNAPLPLRVSWPSCSREPACGDGVCSPGEDRVGCPDDCQNPRGCAGAEMFAYFDPVGQVVVDRREAMRVSWFATAGSFRDDHTGRREEEADDYSDNSWTSPSTLGDVWLWVVLRDSRGGVSWGSYALTVE
jgi:hypothetical protein